MGYIVGFGELLMRLSTPNNLKIDQVTNFNLNYGGGEVNVLISLANLGSSVKLVTKLPKNQIGNSAKKFLRREGVDTSLIVDDCSDESRLGLYFLETGYAIRGSKIVYDRKNSSFSKSKVEDYDYDKIFSGATWFHVSGITTALNEDMFKLTEIMCKEAKKRGVKISFDLNYRATLWDFDKAREKLAAIAKYFDLCIGVEPLKLLEEDYKASKSDTVEDLLKRARLLSSQYDIPHVAFTKRKVDSSNKNTIQCYLYSKKDDKLYSSEKKEVDILDRVGTGDAFTAGILYSISRGYEEQKAIDFAGACFAIKHTIFGDINSSTFDEVVEVMKNNFEINR